MKKKEKKRIINKALTKFSKSFKIIWKTKKKIKKYIIKVASPNVQ